MTPGQGGGGGPLRFATFLAPNVLPVYRFLAERIAERLGRPVELVVGTSFDPTARPALDRGLIERFSPVDDADYDDIRAMLAVIEAARWTSLTQTAVGRRSPAPGGLPSGSGSMEGDASEGSRPWRSRTSSPRHETP
jgi:hypothetical protein